MSGHTPGLTRDQVFGIADKYGVFEFGDAQGDKRLAFAADVIAAHERIRAAAPDLLAALEMARNGLLWYRDACPQQAEGSDDEALAQIDAALTAATGEAP